METSLVVSKIETLHSDKANCDFKSITFTQVQHIGNKERKTNIQAVRNLWPEHKVMVDGKETVIKADTLHDDIFVGDLVDGKIFSTRTTPASPGRTR